MVNDEQPEVATQLPSHGRAELPKAAIEPRPRTIGRFRLAVILALTGLLVGCAIGYVAFGKPLAAGVLCFALGVLASEVIGRRSR